MKQLSGSKALSRCIQCAHLIILPALGRSQGHPASPRPREDMCDICGIVLYHILSIIIRCFFTFRLLNFAIVGGLAVWPMKIKIQPVEIETKRPNIVAFDGVP